MKILVGLGNPGENYQRNRHNVGFEAINAIAERYGAPQWRKRFQGLAAEIDIARQRYLLLKPSTYMNESGRSVSEAVRFFKISPADVIVFHDEIDLEPGKLRVKFGGGHAGHNGLKSISAHVGNDYQRVRIGVGHPGNRDAVAHYVLHDFARADRDWLDPLLAAIAQGLPSLLAGQDARFMNDVGRAARPQPAPAKTAKPAEAPRTPPAAKVAAPSPRPEPVVATAAPPAPTAAAMPAPAAEVTPAPKVEPVKAPQAAPAAPIAAAPSPTPAHSQPPGTPQPAAATAPSLRVEPAPKQPAEPSVAPAPASVIAPALKAEPVKAPQAAPVATVAAAPPPPPPAPAGDMKPALPKAEPAPKKQPEPAMAGPATRAPAQESGFAKLKAWLRRG